MALRVPPGRSGRTWLTERLATARRGAGLLERKQAGLRRELGRIEELVTRTDAEWKASCGDADRWMLRALILGGGAVARRDGTRAGEAQAELRWVTEMGVTYPHVATCRLPPPSAFGGPTALHAAAIAYRRALGAAVRHAAASAARDRLAHELLESTRRLRAIRECWIPRLEELRASVELQLDEGEREELVRARWARAEGT